MLYVYTFHLLKISTVFPFFLVLKMITSHFK